MKKVLIGSVLFFCNYFSNAQSNVFMTAVGGATNNELETILYFEEIGYEKFTFKGAALNGKDFQINIKEYKNGKLAGIDSVFTSKGYDDFKIKTDSLQFSVLTKATDNNEFKIRFQFNGFAAVRKYSLPAAEKDKFALKDFLGSEREKEISLQNKNYILAYMLPYVRPDKSTTYCEVAQSGLDPEKLYDKYLIRHYYLVEIKFE